MRGIRVDPGEVSRAAVSPDSTEIPEPHIFSCFRMDEALNHSGARFRKRLGGLVLVMLEKMAKKKKSLKTKEIEQQTLDSTDENSS